MMPDKNKILLLLILILIFRTAGFSQKKEIELANSAYNELQYNAASEYYLKAIKKIKENTPEKQQATFMLAECYRMMNKTDLAEPYYKLLIESNYDSTNPVIYIRYATVLKTQGNVTGSKEYYLKYLKGDPGNQEAKMGVKSCEWLLANQHKAAQVNVLPVSNINSDEDDFGPAFLSRNFDQLVFTSNRIGENGKNRDQWTGSRFSDLYKSTLSEKSWSDPAPIEYFGALNSDIHEGTPALNGDFTTMYFTRCDRMAEKKIYCQIWKTEKSENRWMAPKMVLADSTANVGQPSISKDELTLVFSSDMKGSKGGKDIWVVHRESKEQDFVQPAVLLPGINTSGDEVFPYLFNDTTLFFSSNGYEGFGSWDIYRSTWRNNSWSTPQILFPPINSGYDDFGIIIKKPDEEGYFTSNRPGGKGGDNIYQFTRKTLLFTVSGHVKDKLTLLAMPGAQVLLTGENRDTANILTDGQGYFKFDTSVVLEDHDYELIFRKNNYFAEKASVTTIPYEDDHDFIIEIKLEPIPEKPIVLPDILYALDKWDLAPQYQDSLMNLVELLHTNETLVIELRSHTDTRGSDEYNEVLSQKRAQTVVDFIISQGIDPRRLVAKGYGEKVPRILDKDVNRENYQFKAGTELNDKFINNLPSEEIKEAAYQLNRRTEFSVLSKDFKP
jgi:peptidoglycan-associated lipoprotein